MAKITFIDVQGESRTVEAEAGSTVMEAAVRNGVPGIEAECGGACACATCHVYVEDGWKEKVGDPEPMEEDMLDFAFEVKPTSRLSCQIRVRDELDGLVVRTPARQGVTRSAPLGSRTISSSTRPGALVRARRFEFKSRLGT